MRKILISLLLLTPAFAFALDYSDISDRYTDAPFGKPEAVAISLLTRLNVVAGNPDGTFAAKRTLNRSEFLKIAFLSFPDVAVSDSDAADCFPDVHATDWFSKYVCVAKMRGVVGGYPDGKFKPGNAVNYVEALKIIETLFGYGPEETGSGANWFQPYIDAAQQRGLLLPMNIANDAQLTRGQMARLAASFIAYSQGDLENYRRAEQGKPPMSSFSSSTSSSTSSSSSSTSTSSSSSSTSTSSSSSSTSSSSSVAHDFPARSHFLIAGERSQPIASATFFANLEPMFVKRAEVKLETAIDGIDTMFVVDRDGVELGQLSLDKIFDSTEKTWRGTLTGNYRIEKGSQKVIGVEVRMKPRNEGGTSEELVQVDTFKLTTEGEWSANGVTSSGDGGPYPKHQTSMGRIVTVSNAQETEGILPLGPGQQLAAFTIGGSAVDGVSLKIEHLQFQVSKSSNVVVTNWQLGIPDTNERFDCTYSESESTVNCLNISDSLGTIGSGSRTFRLFGSTSLLPGNDKNMQISLNLAGNTETTGAIRWTDGTGHFNWVELEQPLARSTIWK